MPDTAPVATAPAPTATPMATPAPVSDGLITGNVPDSTPQAEAPEAPKAPVVPDKYEFKKVGDFSLHADDEATLSSEARALGLTQEQAQKFYETRAASVKAETEALQADIARTRAGWLQEIMSDQRYGGQNFEKNKLAVNRLISQAGDEGKELAALIKSEGLDAHPTLFRFLSKIGSRTGEGSWLSFNGSAAETRTANAPFNPAQDGKLFFGNDKKT